MNNTIIGLVFTLVGFVLSFLTAVSDSHPIILLFTGTMTITGVITYSLTLVDFS
jgi:hypothetical protein